MSNSTDLKHTDQVYTVYSDTSVTYTGTTFREAQQLHVTHTNAPTQVPMDGWMTWSFMSFLTLFQLNQDNGRVVMKGLCNGTLSETEKIPPPKGSNFRTARLVGQCLTK